MQRSRCKARAGNICRAQQQADQDGNSRPKLFSNQLQDEFSLARAVIEIEVDDLLPCPER